MCRCASVRVLVCLCVYVCFCVCAYLPVCVYFLLVCMSVFSLCSHYDFGVDGGMEQLRSRAAAESLTVESVRRFTRMQFLFIILVALRCV